MTERGDASRPVRDLSIMRHGIDNRFVTGGFALALIVMVAIAVASYRSIGSLREHGKLIDHTRQVQIEIQDLAAVSSAARIAWRSFLLTGSHSNVEDFEAAAKALPGQVQLLRQLTADDARQLQRISSYESVATQDIAAMRDSMHKKEAGAFATP